jgi:hypothetical protein
MFPRSCNFLRGKKKLLVQAWLLIPKFIINLVKVTKSIGVQDLNCNFVIFEIFLEILTNVMDLEKIVENPN